MQRYILNDTARYIRSLFRELPEYTIRQVDHHAIQGTSANSFGVLTNENENGRVI